MIIAIRATTFAIIVLMLKLSIANMNISRVNHVLASEPPFDVRNTDWPFLYDTKLTFRYNYVNTISSEYFNYISVG